MPETTTIAENSSKIPVAMRRLATMIECPGFLHLLCGAAEQVEKTGDLSFAVLPLDSAYRAADAAGNGRATRAANTLGNLCRVILSGDAARAANGHAFVARGLADCLA